MNKRTSIQLNSKSFREYSKAVSGLFLVTSGEQVTAMDLKLIWSIKAGFKLNEESFVSKRLRTQLAHAMELKPQTLYNRLSDLKRKGILIKKDGKITLSPVFNSKTNVTIIYNENRKLQESLAGSSSEPGGEIS